MLFWSNKPISSKGVSDFKSISIHTGFIKVYHILYEALWLSRETVTMTKKIRYKDGPLGIITERPV